MSFQRWFKLSLDLLVLDAVAGLLTTPILTVPGFVAMTAAVLLAAWADSRRMGLPLPRRVWSLLPGVFLFVLILDYLMVSSFLAALTHLFLLLLTYKLFDLSTHRDMLWIYLFTFLLLFVAATQTSSVAFLGIFIGYLALGTWSWILFHLKRETEAALPGDGPAVLARTNLVTPRFIASSLGLALGCFLVTLILFFLIPRIGLDTRAGSAQRGARISGYADRVTLDAVGPIRLDSTVVMRVAFPHEPDHPGRFAPLRWRGSSLDTFNGRAWFQSDFLLKPIRGDREFTVARPVPGKPVLFQEIFLEPVGGRQLFAAPRLLSVSGPFPSLRVDSGDGGVVPGEIDRPVRYLALSQPAVQHPQELQVASGEIPAEIRERYLSLPQVSPRVAELVRRIAGTAPAAYDAALLLERYLTTEFVYDLEGTPTAGKDPLEDFLFTRRRGHCEYFAASMAVMLRLLEIPSRVVTGFQRGEWNEMGRFYTVRQRDAHSWVEAYLPGAGWVTFDPSPRGEFERGARGPNGWIAQALEVLRMRWARYVIDYNLGDQMVMATSVRRQLHRSGAALAHAWGHWADGGPETVRGVIGGATLVVAGVGLVSLLLRRSREGTSPVSRQRSRKIRVAFYERALKLLARRRLSRAPASTAREFAAALIGHPVLHGATAEITMLYERVRFGQEPLSRAEEQRVNELLWTLRSVTRSGRPARRAGAAGVEDHSPELHGSGSGPER
jgi:transglutaminase-like putative cysteine protease